MPCLTRFAEDDARLSSSRYLGGRSRGGSGGRGGGRVLNDLVGLVGGSGLGEGSLAIGGRVGSVVLLTGGVDRDLNCDLTTLDFLAVHLGASLLLELLRAEGNETETTALAGLTAGLELLDHEAGDGAEGDLGLGGGVVLEDLKKLIHQLARAVRRGCANSPCPPSGRTAGSQP